MVSLDLLMKLLYGVIVYSVQCKSSYLELWRCDHYYLCQKNYVYVMTELHRKLWMDLHESFWNGCYRKNQLHVVTCDQGCSGKFWFGGTVSETWVSATGELVPHTRRVALLGVGVGGGRPLPLRGCHSWKFFWDFWCQIPRLGAIWARK